MVLSMSLPQGITFVVAQGKVAANALATQLVFLYAASGAGGVHRVNSATVYGLLQTVFAQLGTVDHRGRCLVRLDRAGHQVWAAILAGQQQIAIVNNAEFIGRVTQFLSLFVIAGALYLSGKQLSVGVLFIVTLSASALINLMLFASLGFKFNLSRDSERTQGAPLLLRFLLRGECCAVSELQTRRVRRWIFRGNRVGRPLHACGFAGPVAVADV